MASSVIPQDLKVPTPNNTHCSRNACYHPLRHQGGPSYEGPPVFHSQSEHPQTRARGLSLESGQKAPPLGGQMPVESPAHKLLMVTTESKC